MPYRHVGPFSEIDPNLIEDFGSCGEPYDRTCASCGKLLHDDEPTLCEACLENLADGDGDRGDAWDGGFAENH